MSFLLKNQIHVSLAQAFYNDVLSRRNQYYYFLGKTLPWGATDIPPAITDTQTEEADIRNNIIYMNRVGPNDISFLARRIDWTANTVYDRYDGDMSVSNPGATGATSLSTSNFYVLTSEMNVYKCIDNNSGTESLIKPTGSDYDIIRLSDGYAWKFMYHLPPALQYKFLTPTHMPVLTALNTRFYDNMGIDSVTINNGGSGYSGDEVTRAVVNGHGLNAVLGLNINPETGSISSVRVVNPGYGYTSDTTISIIDAAGTGHGKYGNPTAILTPKLVDGKIDSVVVEDPGVNYTTDVQTNIVVSGTGVGAKLFPVVHNGTIVDVIIDSPGSDYTEVDLAVTGVTGSGAELSVSTGVGDVNSVQSNVELLAEGGAIYLVEPVNLGSGYSYATCSVSGDGTGMAVTPIIYNGQVIRYTVTSFGSGYSWCDITINGDGTGATARAIISPYNGHGYNAIDELFASTIGIYNTIRFTGVNPLMLNNDYREFGLLKNPRAFNDTSLFRSANGYAGYILTLNDVSTISNDQELYLSTDSRKKFVVVGKNDKSQVLIQNMGGAEIKVGDQLVNSVGGHHYVIDNITIPDVEKRSGDLVFVDNRTSIFQTTDQFISLRTTIQF